MADTIGDFAAGLGLDVQEKEWDLGAAVMKKLTAEMRRMAVDAEIARIKGVDVGQAMKTIGLEAPKAIGSTIDFGGVLKAVATAATAAAGAIAGVVATLAHMAFGTIEEAGHLDDLRQKTGLSAEALQGFGYAAKLGGSDTDGFAKGVEHLAISLKKVEDGGKAGAKMASALKSAGLSDEAVAGARAGGQGLVDALEDIAAKFHEMEDGPEKTALAIKIFGKAGADLIPTLNQGRQGLESLRGEAAALGAIMSEDAVSAGDELGDNIDKLKMSLKGVVGEGTSAFFPMIKGVVDGMLGWIRANKDLIQTKVRAFAEGLLTVFRAIGSWLVEHKSLFVAIWNTLGAAIDAATPIVKLFVMELSVVASWFELILRVAKPVLEWIARILDFIVSKIEYVANKLAWIRDKASAGLSSVGDVLQKASGGKRAVLKDTLAPLGAADTSAAPGAAQAMGALGMPQAGLATLPPASQGNVTNAPVFDVTTKIDVHAAPGMSATDVADAARKEFDDMWNQKLRHAKGQG